MIAGWWWKSSLLTCSDWQILINTFSLLSVTVFRQNPVKNGKNLTADSGIKICFAHTCFRYNHFGQRLRADLLRSQVLRLKVITFLKVLKLYC